MSEVTIRENAPTSFAWRCSCGEQDDRYKAHDDAYTVAKEHIRLFHRDEPVTVYVEFPDDKAPDLIDEIDRT